MKRVMFTIWLRNSLAFVGGAAIAIEAYHVFAQGWQYDDLGLLVLALVFGGIALGGSRADSMASETLWRLRGGVEEEAQRARRS